MIRTTRREVMRAVAVIGGGLLVGCGDDDASLDAGSDAGSRLDADAEASAEAGTDAGPALGSDAGPDPLDAGPDATAEPDAGPPPFVLGETKPTAENTGLRVEGLDEASLTVVTGDVVHAADDAVFERTRFTGRVQVRGKRITYRSCWFNASHEVGHSLVHCLDEGCEAIVFESCLFRPSSFGETAETALGNCVFGHDFTLMRCDVSGGIDAVGLYSNRRTVPARDVSILGSYLHDLTYYSPDAGHSDNQTHNDLVQIHYGCERLRVFGSNLVALLDPARGDASTPPSTGAGGEHLGGNKSYPALSAMSGFMFSPRDETAGVADVEIDRNWLGGGIVFINWPRTDGVDVRITRNRWGADTHLHGGDGSPMYVLMQREQVATIEGNVIEATGAPYDRRHNG